MEIKDYLHLYGIGCPIMTPDGLGEVLVIYPRVIEVSLNVIGHKQIMFGRKGGGEMHYKYFYTDDLKLALRPLSDMTEEERKEYLLIPQPYTGFDVLYPNGDRNYTEWINGERIKYLLSKHFDLFGLIESGLAIDKTTFK